MHRSSNNSIIDFAKILTNAGIVTTVRKTRGDDIDAACGQLAGEVQDRTRVVDRMKKRRTIMLSPENEKNKKLFFIFDKKFIGTCYFSHFYDCSDRLFCGKNSN